MKLSPLTLVLTGSLVIMTVACGPTGKLKRAERLIAKAESMGAVWRVDTVYKNVPYYVDSVRVDSIFIAKAGDTVVIEKERLKLKYVRLAGDSVYIEAECEADTVYQNVPVTVTKTIQAKSDWRKWFFIGCAVGFALLFVLSKIAGR